jgi:hypothetical protein
MEKLRKNYGKTIKTYTHLGKLWKKTIRHQELGEFPARLGESPQSVETDRNRPLNSMRSHSTEITR